jgi:hypothetical protein
MASNVKFRIVAAVAVFTTLLGVYSAKFWHPYKTGSNFEMYYTALIPSATTLSPHVYDAYCNNDPCIETGSNFEMYFTAALLVRGNLSRHIYDVIDRDTNPEVLFADRNSVFAQTARAHGIYRNTLYLYPPTLADLLVPLTALSLSAALIVWNVLGVLMIVGLSVALTQTLDVKFWGSTALVAAAVLLFRPTLNTFHWGQVSILLAFLLTLGFSLYVHGHKSIAALLFVLAIAIKLEPIVVIIPFLAWRDWKCLRSLAIWGILLGLGLWAVNGSDALNLYFLHQLPTMSGGQLGSGGFDTNRTLGNIFYTYLGAVVSSRGLAWLVRVVSALILCYAGWLSRLKPRENLTSRRQFEIGMIFVLFICCLSPYSWFYNWALSAPVVVMFCKRAWDGRADIVETVLLIAFLLSLSTSKLNMAMVTPLLGVTLAIVALYRIRNVSTTSARVNEFETSGHGI